MFKKAFSYILALGFAVSFGIGSVVAEPRELPCESGIELSCDDLAPSNSQRPADDGVLFGSGK